MKIGIDIMGGDFAPDATISGAISAYNELPKGRRGTKERNHEGR